MDKLSDFGYRRLCELQTKADIRSFNYEHVGFVSNYDPYDLEALTWAVRSAARERNQQLLLTADQLRNMRGSVVLVRWKFEFEGYSPVEGVAYGIVEEGGDVFATSEDGYATLYNEDYGVCWEAKLVTEEEPEWRN